MQESRQREMRTKKPFEYGYKMLVPEAYESIAQQGRCEVTYGKQLRGALTAHIKRSQFIRTRVLV